MASAPQKVTRTAATARGAPPARAPSPPSSARKTSELPATSGTRSAVAETAATITGSAAPTAKVAAEASAACSGRAVWISERPSSSRACAPRASCVHQLHGHLMRQLRVEPAAPVDGSQFFHFVLGVLGELAAFAFEVGLFGVGLRADRDVFPRGHRQRACRQARDARQQHGRARGAAGGHADDQAGRRDEPVIGAQNGGAQPADAVGHMAFGMVRGHRGPFRQVGRRGRRGRRGPAARPPLPARPPYIGEKP